MQEERSGERWQTWAAVIFVMLTAVAGVYLLFRYAAGILLPFLIAWGVGLIIHPFACKVSRRLHLPQKLCAAVLMLLLLGWVTLFLLFAANRLLAEAQHLLLWLEREGATLGEGLSAAVERLRAFAARLPLVRRLQRVEGLEEVLGQVDEMVTDMIREGLSELSRRIPEWVGRVVRGVPSFLIFTVVTLVACFYFSADLATVHRAMQSFLPPRFARRLPAWRARMKEVLRQYARAYLLILVITFLELYVALSILGVEYAFLIAALTALLDILPVLGVGIVLIPWAAVLLIGRRFYVGVGLLITYAVVMAVRQIIEPRVVSGSLGLHPLLTLFCMYVGYRVFGLFGMMLAPAATIVLAGRSADHSSSGSGP
ncbi:MAG: sporulation integral membrane protein YtvI [Clostridia bacterium]|nr:sporulation integral membrane protein YtvI [Clostridia bacterium]